LTPGLTNEVKGGNPKRGRSEERIWGPRQNYRKKTTGKEELGWKIGPEIQNSKRAKSRGGKENLNTIIDGRKEFVGKGWHT